VTRADAKVLFYAVAALALCGAAPRQSCDTRQAAQKVAEANLSQQARRMVGTTPPRITERNNGMHWEVSWPTTQQGAAPVVMMINRITCGVVYSRP
jgi:hypothetical protein